MQQIPQLWPNLCCCESHFCAGTYVIALQQAECSCSPAFTTNCAVCSQNALRRSRLVTACRVVGRVLSSASQLACRDTNRSADQSSCSHKSGVTRSRCNLERQQSSPIGLTELFFPQAPKSLRAANRMRWAARFMSRLCSLACVPTCLPLQKRPLDPWRRCFHSTLSRLLCRSLLLQR